MRVIVIITFSLFILLSSFIEKRFDYTSFSKAKLIGIYDRDSLLNEIPAYRKAMESAAAHKREFDSIHVAMYEKLAEYRSNFKRDSAKFSTIVKELKLLEIEDMRINIAQYAFYATEDIKARNDANYHRFDDLLKAAAANVSKNKNLDAVLDKKETVEYKKQNSPVKSKNVTNDMRMQLGLSK